MNTFYMIAPLDDGPLQTDVRFLFKDQARQAAKRYADHQQSAYAVFEVKTLETINPGEDI